MLRAFYNSYAVPIDGSRFRKDDAHWSAGLHLDCSAVTLPNSNRHLTAIERVDDLGLGRPVSLNVRLEFADRREPWINIALATPVGFRLLNQEDCAGHTSANIGNHHLPLILRISQVRERLRR